MEVNELIENYNNTGSLETNSASTKGAGEVIPEPITAEGAGETVSEANSEATSNEVVEGDSETNSTEEKPWKKQIAIPKYRFDEVNNQKKELENALRVRDERLRELESKLNSNDKNKSDDIEIDSLDKYDSADEWAKANLTKIAEKTRLDTLREIEERQRQAEIANQNTSKADKFYEKLRSVGSENPENMEIIQYVDNSIAEYKAAGGKIHPAVEDAIVTSEHADKLYLEFGKTGLKALEQLITVDPSTALKMIGRMEAKFESPVETKTIPNVPKTITKSVPASNRTISNESSVKDFYERYSKTGRFS